MAGDVSVKERCEDIAFTRGIFLNDDMVCTAGDGSARKDTHRFAAIERALKGVPRRRFANNGEFCASFADIGELYRIAIHSRGIERGEGDFGFDIYGQDCASTRRQRRRNDGPLNTVLNEMRHSVGNRNHALWIYERICFTNTE